MKNFKFVLLLLIIIIFSCSTSTQKDIVKYHIKYFTIVNGTSDNLWINIMTIPDSLFFGEYNLVAGDSQKYAVPESNIIPWATSEADYKINIWSYPLQPINFINSNEISFTWTTVFMKNNSRGIIKKIKQPSVSF